MWRLYMNKLHDPLWATPILKSTGLPADWPEWDEEIRYNYVADVMLGSPMGFEVEVIDDTE